MKSLTMQLILVALLLASPSLAQRGLKNIPDPDPEIERKTFKLADGFEVSLYAGDPMLAKPIQMNFDADGRLWIASSEIYPQIKPGQKADDKIIVLEDTNRDGKADKTTIFARGLLIPTAVIHDNQLGYGAYVANSTELLHLRDTDGDGKADSKRVVLTGFGTEDTHHILHTFRWGVDGMLYMNQSIYIHSHIETPYGVRRLNGGGIWYFRPETMELEIFCKGQVNPWGHQQDRWGQSFSTDGAYNQGTNYTFPGAVFLTSPGAKRILKGLNQGQPKHCGLEIVNSRHLPEEWRNTYITNDFRGNRVNAFRLKEDGSAYQSTKLNDLLTSTHVAFRPIDVKIGPDGAIYIADWYNPIIQHGEVDFRDPRRDHVHGRIWRISHKHRDLVWTPKLLNAKVAELLPLLKSPEDFTRHHARLQLKTRGEKKVVPSLAKWVASLDKNDANYEHQRLEALWAYQSLNVVNDALLGELLRSQDHRVRAAATRVLFHWRKKMSNAHELLATQIQDDHPRVRLEAIHALRELQTLEAAQLAMQALDKPVDNFIDYALWLTARETSGLWLPALQKGEPVFGNKPSHVTFALKAAESKQAVGALVKLVREGKLEGGNRQAMLELIASLGGPNELAIVFRAAVSKSSVASVPERVALLNKLLDATRQRRVKPAGKLDAVAELIGHQNQSLASTALRAAGTWKIGTARAKILELIESKQTPGRMRQAAIDGIALLGGNESKQTLAALSAKDKPMGVRMSAAVALSSLDVQHGAQAIATIIAELPNSADAQGMLRPLLTRKGAPEALAKALTGKSLPPDVAKRAVRTVNSSGRQAPQLLNAIMEAGQLTQPKRTLTEAEMSSLVEEVLAKGNPARGEQIYRSAQLRCATCHAIGGAGGAVGPDMTSLGASAPVDYIIESLMNPAAKVKEGYHAKQIETKDGDIIVGVFVRKTDTGVILRTSEDKEVTIAANNIFSQKDAPSLMPPGLTDGLTRPEFVDLVAFMSKLGKEGDYKVTPQRFIRTWRTPIGTKATGDFYRHGGVAVFPKNQAGVQWTPVYSLVNGAAPWNETYKGWVNGPRYGLLRGKLEVTTAGSVALKLSNTEGVLLFVGDKQVPVSGTTTFDVSKGTHTLTFAIMEGKHRGAFSAELVDVKGSPARARVVNGK